MWRIPYLQYADWIQEKLDKRVSKKKLTKIILEEDVYVHGRKIYMNHRRRIYGLKVIWNYNPDK